LRVHRLHAQQKDARQYFGPSAFRQNLLLAPTGDIRQATRNGKIERGTAVIERPWIRFSE
jgi:hypothetical protein